MLEPAAIEEQHPVNPTYAWPSIDAPCVDRAAAKWYAPICSP